MSVPYQRISNATVKDIIFYDPASERRAANMNVNWEDYFHVGSQEWLYKLEFGWWQKYCDTVFGASYYTNNSKGQMITAFNPDLLLKDDQTLIRLDTFKAVEIFYESLVSDTSNVNDVDKANYDHAAARSQNEWTKALQLMNFYDLYEDGAPTTKLEENWTADVDYFNNDRRYF
ncbi:MAG: hypothetical protein ACOVLB_07900 [Candidatus Nanopelagicus sp.]